MSEEAIKKEEAPTSDEQKVPVVPSRGTEIVSEGRTLLHGEMRD
jgi:hypothetical protein